MIDYILMYIWQSPESNSLKLIWFYNFLLKKKQQGFILIYPVST